MTEKDIFEQTAKEFNITTIEAETEMKKAIEAAGFNGSVSDFIEYAKKLVAKQIKNNYYHL